MGSFRLKRKIFFTKEQEEELKKRADGLIDNLNNPDKLPLFHKIEDYWDMRPEKEALERERLSLYMKLKKYLPANNENNKITKGDIVTEDGLIKNFDTIYKNIRKAKDAENAEFKKTVDKLINSLKDDFSREDIVKSLRNLSNSINNDITGDAESILADLTEQISYLNKNTDKALLKELEGVKSLAKKNITNSNFLKNVNKSYLKELDLRKTLKLRKGVWGTAAVLTTAGLLGAAAIGATKGADKIRRSVSDKTDEELDKIDDKSYKVGLGLAGAGALTTGGLLAKDTLIGHKPIKVTDFDQLKPGDLIFRYTNSRLMGVENKHYGLYLGDGNVVEMTYATTTEEAKFIREYLEKSKKTVGGIPAAEFADRVRTSGEVKVRPLNMFCAHKSRNIYVVPEFMKSRTIDEILKVLPKKIGNKVNSKFLGMLNNCEHTATDIKYGKAVSSQSRNRILKVGLGGSILAGSLLGGRMLYNKHNKDKED